MFPQLIANAFYYTAIVRKICQRREQVRITDLLTRVIWHDNVVWKRINESKQFKIIYFQNLFTVYTVQYALDCAGHTHAMPSALGKHLKWLPTWSGNGMNVFHSSLKLQAFLVSITNVMTYKQERWIFHCPDFSWHVG